ncbi:MAG TPA: SAM-dependent methyltransferase [Pyrinomonadaceae bacterium]|nr:SAM-dependent methyltransferase [Pyrinomonadaceae bacterium]
MPVSLAKRLKERIRREGPITFHDWMKTALYDPAGGYYQKSDLVRWGREGDYRTSPERSELFAATFARYFAKLYDELQRPADWTIVEGGAGDGSFAWSVLQTLADRHPAVFEATRYLVCELSVDGRRRAQERLVGFGERVQFCTELPDVERGLYFSNELLDSFPVHRVVKKDEKSSELYVSVASNGDFEWSFGPLSTTRLTEFIENYSPRPGDGQIIEINLEIDDWLAQVANRLTNGFVITVDYGAEAVELYDSTLRPEGTLRAFSRHGFVDDVLAQPGEYDITATVSWTQVKTVGERLGLRVVEFASQNKFLLNAGLLEELEHRMTTTDSDAERARLSTGAREMILPGRMASSFQVLVQRRVKEDAANVP